MVMWIKSSSLGAYVAGKGGFVLGVTLARVCREAEV
jgi:hypothetical protein